MSSRIHLALLPAAMLATAIGVAACHGATPEEGRINPEPVPGQTAFESDDPSADAGSPTGASDTGTSSASDASAPAPGDKSESPERAIEEADIIKVEGSRLYALSKIGGLSVIDVSTRDKLKFLGRWRANGEPFEMYVRDNVVLAMVNGFQEWTYDAGGGYSSKQTSRVIALDVKDPTKIASIGDFAVPGEVSDSRVVGDVMYVVSHQNGYCWKCDSKPATVVMSLGIKDVRAISKVDQVAFVSTTASYSWWKRSVSATSTRFWIGGPEYSWTSGSKPRSTIQALDVSDPTGKLSLGASVLVDGLIQSRWQMDELAGVLRVVSQPGGWTGAEPTVETFTVKSSSVVTPLGRTTLKLPKPETLMSVRFDGNRGYAITAERTDPLFTIDLTDPAKPVQMGELEMPGWVYHMEPRGNRLLGLGFDAANPEGGMTVSLFDVSNLATPKMIKRVNFGKGWASAPEDRDRIHKAFRVLDDEKLIMVPFSSHDWRSKDGSCHTAQSGIQLIDWKDDTLALRGVAGVYGSPRRAFLHDQRLFAVSDSQVATYDIANRDAPAAKASLPLANPSHKSAVMGEHLVQLSHDWWSQHAQLVVMPRSNVDQAIPTATLDLAPMIGASTCGYAGWGSWWNAALYVKGTYAYVVVPSSYYGYWDGGAKESATLVGVVDLKDPSKPVLVGKASIPTSSGYYDGYGYYGYYGNAVLSAGASSVFTGDAVVSYRAEYVYDPATGKGALSAPRVSVLDLRDPKNPRAGGTATLAAWPMYTGLQVFAGKVYTSHYEPTSGGKVRFYLDELDVSNPAAPKVAKSVNVPGSLLALDAQSGRAVTVDYRRTFHSATDHSACAKAAPVGDAVVFDWSTKTCVSIHRVLRLVKVDGAIASLEQSLELPKSPIGSVTVADARVLFRSGYYYYDYSEYGPSSPPSDRAWVLNGVPGGAMTMSPEIVLGTGSYGGSAWANGDRAVVSVGRQMVVVDLAAAKVVRKAELNGYWTSHVAIANDNAYASLGEYGVTAIALR